LTITSIQELIKTAKETTTLVTTETKFVTSTQTIEDVRLRELLERINRTTFENVDRYVRSVAPGWTAQQMAHDLEERFWVETKILTKDNVQYLFLRFKCNCCPTIRWWWVTWRGLLPASEAPVRP
jgi:pyruvate-formate lyase